jgi:hypothetical protein
LSQSKTPHWLKLNFDLPLFDESEKEEEEEGSEDVKVVIEYWGMM